MKWEGQRQSDNVEDRRDGGDDGGGDDGGGGGLRLGGRGIGLGSVAIALVAGWIFGINPLTVLGLLDGSGDGAAPTTQSAPAAAARKPPAADKQAAFVATVLADTEDVWREQFKAINGSYQEPTLVLFRGATPTACGRGETASGPFYCPGDQKVYIDLAFYDILRDRLGAPGDFAQAYVIAHEVGHHVQNLLGISGKLDAQRGKIPEVRMNALSVRLELQADCLAGVWAFHTQSTKQVLEQGDIEEALNAASQIGDDTLQRQSQGTVRPDSFTHGSSAQRVTWFKRGIGAGRMADCNTFEARQL